MLPSTASGSGFTAADAARLQRLEESMQQVVASVAMLPVRALR
jgi:hypothetical protein